jgi:hypothetical protein
MCHFIIEKRRNPLSPSRPQAQTGALSFFFRSISFFLRTKLNAPKREKSQATQSSRHPPGRKNKEFEIITNPYSSSLVFSSYSRSFFLRFQCKDAAEMPEGYPHRKKIILCGEGKLYFVTGVERRQ